MFHVLSDVRTGRLTGGTEVLLGDAPSDKNKMDYPTLKVADWGLAEYTSMQDSDNSMKWKNYGTIAWCPPVGFHPSLLPGFLAFSSPSFVTVIISYRATHISEI